MDNANIQQQIDNLKERLSLVEEIIAKMNGDDSQDNKKKLSLREFLITKKPSDDVKKTLAIGYFLEKFEGVSSFNTDDLLSAYEKAKEKKPLNINDKVNMNIKNGHMAEAPAKKDSKKAWYVTNSGESFVDNGFVNSK